MNFKIFIIAVPIAITLALFAPLSGDGWRSACGCTPADVSFIDLVEGNNGKWTRAGLWELKEAQVANGFLKLIPLGSNLATIQDNSNLFDGICARTAEQRYSCNYWLQFSDTETRGWAVDFGLSASGQLVSVDAKKIWRALKTVEA